MLTAFKSSCDLYELIYPSIDKQSQNEQKCALSFKSWYWMHRVILRETSIDAKVTGYFHTMCMACIKPWAPSIWIPSYPGMSIPMLNIRRSQNRLIFDTGIPMLVRRLLYIETPPWSLWSMTNDPKVRGTSADLAQCYTVILSQNPASHHWLVINLLNIKLNIVSYCDCYLAKRI